MSVTSKAAITVPFKVPDNWKLQCAYSKLQDNGKNHTTVFCFKDTGNDESIKVTVEYTGTLNPCKCKCAK